MESIEKKKPKWRPFINLLVKSKVPWHWYILAVILQFGITTLYVKTPQLAGQIMQGQIFDKVIVNKYIGITIVMSIIALGRSLFNSWILYFTDRNIQRTVWKKFIKIPMPLLDKVNPSSLPSRVTSDVSNLSYAINYFFSLVNSTYSLWLTLTTIYMISPKMLPPMAALIPIIFIVNIVSGKFMYKGKNLVQETFSDFTAFVSERLFNLRLVKSLGTEDFETSNGNEKANKAANADIYLANVDLFSQMIVYSLEAFCTAVVLIYGGMLVGKGELDAGSLFTLYIYAGMIAMDAIQYIFFYQELKKAQGSTKKVTEIWESESESFKRNRSFSLPDADINFEKVSFGYDKENILSNLSFTIPSGKITAIVGPSGSGKTTVLKLLERFYIPNKGQIKFGDVPVEDINLDEWRRSIGYVPQNAPLLSGTIRDNIVYGLDREATDEEIIRAAKLANAYDFISNLPEGFNTDIGEFGSSLSGGERQRVAIARTIIKDPDYLLLDEATCNLDAQNECEVQEALNNMMSERTTIIVAHNIKTVANADNIIVLEDGKVKAIGKHNELYQGNSLYKKYYDLQFDV